MIFICKKVKIIESREGVDVYIGIDLGTSGMKSIIINKNKDIIWENQEDYPFLTPHKGWVEQDPEEWKNALIKTIKKIPIKLINKINAISFSGQMHGSVFLDSENNIIRNAILWNDQRTQKQVNELNNHFPKEVILKKTGNLFLTGFTAPKILWLKQEEPQNFKKIKKIILPKDYLAFLLTGQFATDYSDASGTGYFDPKSKDWDDDILLYLGVNRSQLPKLYNSVDVCGHLKKEFSKKFGFKNIKVIIGGGDQAVGAIGVGAISEGIASISFGTSGVVLAPKKIHQVDKEGRLHAFSSANGDYFLMGVSLSTGNSLKWWMNNVLRTKNFSKFIGKEMSERKISEIIFTPYLTGERTPHFDSEVRSSILNLDIQHDVIDITKAILEGIIFSLNDSIKLLEENKIIFKKILIHGGMTKNKFFNQMVADIFNKEIMSLNYVNGPAYGAAILAMAGNLNKNITELVNWSLKDSVVYTPNQKKTNIYFNKNKLYTLSYKKHQKKEK